MIFIRGDLITKRSEYLETNLCLELIVCNKNSLYRLSIGLLRKITNMYFLMS